MIDAKAGETASGLVLEFALDARVETVWRAIATPGLRARWLPGRELTGAEELPARLGREVRFTMRDDEPPFVETTVTFTILPRGEAGTLLRITQGVPDLGAGRRAANGDAPPTMRAA